LPYCWLDHIDAANDQNAIEKARQLVGGCDVKLWQQTGLPPHYQNRFSKENVNQTWIGACPIIALPSLHLQ